MIQTAMVLLTCASKNTLDQAHNYGVTIPIYPEKKNMHSLQHTSKGVVKGQFQLVLQYAVEK